MITKRLIEDTLGYGIDKEEIFDSGIRMKIELTKGGMFKARGIGIDVSDYDLSNFVNKINIGIRHAISK